MTRVFAPGVFDVFHIGHLNYLMTASHHGDELIVAVQEDRAVERQKNVHLVTPLPERIALIEQLRFVKEVISYANVFQGPLLHALSIDVFACGEDYGNDPRYPDQKKTLDYCATHGLRIVRIPRTTHVSSTAVRSQLKRFWSSRAAKETDLPAGVTTLGSFNGEQDKVRQQTIREASLIARFADRHRASSIIDLGCGDGRHLFEIAPGFNRVAGVDFAEELISIAHRKLATVAPHVILHVADVTEFKTSEQFDIVLLSGITPCLDDVQFENLLSNTAQMAHPNSHLLIRASISIGKRIDLVNFFSAELNTTYTAYYRTKAEMTQAVSQHGWALCNATPLYQHQEDTAVWWFEFERIHRPL